LFLATNVYLPALKVFFDSAMWKSVFVAVTVASCGLGVVLHAKGTGEARFRIVPAAASIRP
jgi:hypothetical protein